MHYSFVPLPNPAPIRKPLNLIKSNHGLNIHEMKESLFSDVSAPRLALKPQSVVVIEMKCDLQYLGEEWIREGSDMCHAYVC